MLHRKRKRATRIQNIIHQQHVRPGNIHFDVFANFHGTGGFGTAVVTFEGDEIDARVQVGRDLNESIRIESGVATFDELEGLDDAALGPDLDSR